MTVCRLCQQRLDPEHPMSVHGRNPETWRQGWMHSDCYQVAYDDLAEQPASRPEYQDRQDEYDQMEAAR